MVQNVTSVEVVEEEAALLVTSWLESNGTSCVTLHAVVMFIMCLHICAKFEEAMLGIVNAQAGDEFSWAKSVRHTFIWRKRVEPKNTVINHLNDEVRRKGYEWQCGMKCPTAFLDYADKLFDLRNVFISTADVGCHTGWQSAGEASKLSVSMQFNNSE